MDKKRVVVSDVLSHVKSALQDQGYEVLGMNDLNQNPAAVVVSGLDDDMMGIQNVEVNAPIIDANGLSANEVLSELRKRLGRFEK